jgi:hypothetical protein
MIQTPTFESLDERMRHDAQLEKSPAERLGEAILIAVCSVGLFGGIYYAVQLLNG